MNTLEKVLEEAKRRRVPLPPPVVRRSLRLAAGLTQEEVASLLSIARASLARYELGQREPRGTLRQEYEDVLSKLRGAK